MPRLPKVYLTTVTTERNDRLVDRGDGSRICGVGNGG
jgi:hypothetical protein